MKRISITVALLALGIGMTLLGLPLASLSQDWLYGVYVKMGMSESSAKAGADAIGGLLVLASWFGIVVLAMFSTMELVHKWGCGK